MKLFSNCYRCKRRFRYKFENDAVPMYCKVCHNKVDDYKKTKYDWV